MKTLLFTLLIFTLTSFYDVCDSQLLESKSDSDTLLKSQTIATRLLSSKEWRKMKKGNYFDSVWEHKQTGKYLVHWYPKLIQHRELPSVYTKSTIHHWGLIQKTGKQVVLLELFNAPSHMHLQLSDSIDFNGDKVPDLRVNWSYSHYFNNEFSTGKMNRSGVFIWDIANARNMLSLKLSSSGNSWNMCRGGSSNYNYRYYDCKALSDTLQLAKYEGQKVISNKRYVWVNERFELSQ